MLSFQSAPLTEARGDAGQGAARAGTAKFQSAPLTEARGDRPLRPDTAPWSGFNPLPSPKQGETATGSLRRGPSEVSIRSPHRSKGRPKDRCTQNLAERFQSAPLTEARGDALAKWGMPGLATFQSAPLTEARGDSRLGASSDRPAGFNPLPSPKQGETDDLAAASLR